MARVTRTYITKSNTIVKPNKNCDGFVNTSQNQILELNHGALTTRILLYFDHTKVKEMVEEGTYSDLSKLHHVLHMTNAASYDYKLIRNCVDSAFIGKRERACSFDIIYFLIPEYWDEGRGSDYLLDGDPKYRKVYDTNACSWMRPVNEHGWQEDGVWSTEHLSREVDYFLGQGDNKIVIGFQHFDKGNEPLEFDITEIFNKFITGELENYGVGIAFSPRWEEDETKQPTQYVGFFSNNTHTFFEPYIETRYDETIHDDRGNFTQGRVNRLYFYSSVGGQYENLDEIPTCEIDGEFFDVQQAERGVYYIEVDGDKYELHNVYYDTWGNIKYKGRKYPSKEMSFCVLESSSYVSFGTPMEDSDKEIVPSVYGIQYAEKIQQGDIRRICVESRIAYTINQCANVESMEYRLYIKEGDKEVDVISYTPVEMAFNLNYFLIDTSELIPMRYYLDIKIKQNMQILHHRDVIEFDVVSDVTARER